MKKTTRIASTRIASTRAAFAALLITLSISINILVIYSMPLGLNLLGWIYAWLLELALFGLAYDLSEVILCLIYREAHLPSLPFLEHHPSVALVCVTCDDADEGTLLLLSHQNYPNLEIFILDDSQLPESMKAINKLGLNVVRRKGRDRIAEHCAPERHLRLRVDRVDGREVHEARRLGAQGVQALHEAHPEVPIHLAALDSHLDENKYIVPGLGDAGDRLYGTSH